MTAYELKPLDTLFFRGNTPMEAGLVKAESVFPPPVSVIKGAFTTAILKQTDKLSESENFKKSVLDSVKVKAVLVKKDGKLYAPAPATLYAEKRKEKDEAEKESSDFKHFVEMNLLKAKPISKFKEGLKEKLGIKCSEGDIPFVKENVTKTEAKSLSGNWIRLEKLSDKNESISKDDILLSGDIFSKEDRTGVELDSKRHTVEGQLYSASHLRLKEDVSIVICLEDEVKAQNIPLDSKGIIQLGGEKRLSSYKKFSDVEIPETVDGFYVSFVPIEATEENMKKIVASGKMQVTAGWDLVKKFHKPTTNWIPAGAVFTEKV